MRTRRRLGAGHPATHIPAYAGVWSLLWKDWVQANRLFDIWEVISWLALFGAGLGMLVAPAWGTRLWVFIAWGLLISQVCSKRFHSDLNLWMVLRQLPFSPRQILLAEIARPVFGSIILCWFAFAICGLIGLHPSIPVAVLAPGIILCIAQVAAFDIVRQSRADALVVGHAPEMGALGLILGLLLTGLPLALVMWISGQMGSAAITWLVSLLGLLLCLGIAYGMCSLAAARYKNIK